MQIPLWNNLIDVVKSFRKKPIVMLLIEPDIQSARLVEIDNNAQAMTEIKKLLGTENIGILPRLDRDNRLLFSEDAQLDESVNQGFYFSPYPGDWGKTYWGPAIILGEHQGEGTTWSSDTLSDQELVFQTREDYAQFLADLAESDARFGYKPADYGPGLDADVLEEAFKA